MVLNPESPGTGGHQRVCLGSKRFFFFSQLWPKAQSRGVHNLSPGTGPSCSCQPCSGAGQRAPRIRPRRGGAGRIGPGPARGRGSSPRSDVAGGRRRGGGRCRSGSAGSLFHVCKRSCAQARPAPPELRAPSPAPRPPRAPLLASPDGVQGPGPAAPAAAAAAAAALGDRAGSAGRGPGPGLRHGAADRAALRARRVPAHCAQRRLRALPLRGDIPRRPEVRLQVPLPARPAGVRAPSLRTGLSRPADLPQPRPARLALLPPHPARGSPTLNPAAPGASVRALRLPGSSHAGLGSRRSPCVAESGRGTRSQRTDKGGIDGRWPRRGGPRARGRCWGSPAASLNRAVPRAPSLDRPGRRCRSRWKQLPRCRSDFGVPAWF